MNQEHTYVSNSSSTHYNSEKHSRSLNSPKAKFLKGFSIRPCMREKYSILAMPSTIILLSGTEKFQCTCKYIIWTPRETEASGGHCSQHTSWGHRGNTTGRHFLGIPALFQARVWREERK